MRFVVYVVADSVAAIFGTTLVSHTLAKFLRAGSAGGVILREWVLSILIAGLLGALIAAYRKSNTSIWAWVLPGLAFLLRALLYVTRWRTAFFATFSGYECAISLQQHDCQDFFVFSVSLIRAASYSAGAWLVMNFSHRKNDPVDVGSGEDLTAIHRNVDSTDSNVGGPTAS